MADEPKKIDSLAALYFPSFNPQTHYDRPWEQAEDWLRLTDLLCAALFLLTQGQEGAALARRGGLGEEADLLLLLEASVPGGRRLEPVPDFGRLVEGLMEKADQSLEQGLPPLPLHRLLLQAALSDFQFFCLILGLAPDWNRKYERIFGVLQNDHGPARATLGLAADLYSLVRPVEEWELALIRTSITQADSLLFEPEATPADSLLRCPLRPNGYVLNALAGLRALPEELAEYCSLVLEEQPMEAESIAHPGELERLLALLQSHSSYETPLVRLLHLQGPMGSGRRFLLRQAAARLEHPLLFVDAVLLMGLPPERLRRHLALISAECVLGGALLCLCNFDPAREQQGLAERILLHFARRLELFVLTGREALPFSPPGECALFPILLRNPVLERQQAMWEYFLRAGDYRLAPDTDREKLINTYDLTPGQIKAVLESARMDALACGGDQISQTQLIRAVRESSRVLLGDCAELMQTGFTWDDLVISPESETVLRRACARVRYRREVLERWGFEAKLPYGKGLTILLYGPPGTGKTMAAQVLAWEMGMDLYRIDLSQMVSKYIGETEKNLSQVFDAAKDVNAVLFFDEADALFSKRTEIKDSHDKHANAEVAFLLQKIESHNGVTILATNIMVNVDAAFKRRIHFIAAIELPDAETRLRIWQRVFPPQAKVEGVNFRFFADRFELSGSEIKSIALSASYVAAQEGQAVTHQSLLAAVYEEYKKNGRLLLQQDML